MASLMPALDNISWDRIERESAVTYPSDAPDQPGHDVVFGDRFPTQDGRGKLVPAKHHAAGRAARRRVPVRAHRPAASSSTGTPAP